MKSARASALMPLCAALLCGIGMARVASGQATSVGLKVRAVAEIETESQAEGRRIVKLAPATRVVPGDQVIYTLEIRNASGADLHEPVVTFPIPMHMSYLADTASGPGADVTFSRDGGREFGRPENLSSPDGQGGTRLAPATEYTHIRWALRATLKSKSVAYARFRAVVK